MIFNTDPEIINNVNDLGENYICINKIYYCLSYTAEFDIYSLIPITYNKTSMLDSDNDDDICSQLTSDKKIVCINNQGYITKIFKADATTKKFLGNSSRTYIIKN